MRETKDSGVDWIGEVPVNWEIVPIKADVSIGHGSDPTTPGDIPVWGSGGEPFKTCGEHKNGPAVLLGRKGTLDCPQLVTGLYWNVDTAFDAKVTGKKISLNFFYYAATCVDIKPYMTNTAKPSMTQFDWGNSRIPRPPLSEQSCIVSYLDERCAVIDEDVAKRREVIEKLEEYRKSLIAHAVTKGLDPNAEMKDSGIEWIGEVPADWTMTPNYVALRLIKNNVVGDKAGDYPLLSLTKQGIIKRNVEDGGKFPASFDSYQIVQPGQMAFCLFDIDETPRTVGLSDIEGMITGAYDVFEINNNVCDPRFVLYYYTAVDDGKHLRLYYKSMRKTITPPAFAHVKMPVPSLSEQRRIVSYLDERCAAIDEAISRQKRLIEKLGEYRKSIIHHAVTGKIDCTEA